MKAILKGHVTEEICINTTYYFVERLSDVSYSPLSRCSAFWLSWVSLVCTIIAAIGGIVGFKKTESTLILTFGLENFVDFMSSVVVLWRFYCPHGLDELKIAKLQKREERASLTISFIIGILGIFILSVAIYDFCTQDKEQDMNLLFVISFISILVFGSLSVIKFKYARDLNSPSLYKDGICSLIGTSLSASLLLTTAIIEHSPKAAFIDPTVSLLIGVGAIFYGFKVVYNMVQSGVPIFHPDWWVTKKNSERAGAETFSQELPPVQNGEKDGEGENINTEKTEHEVI
ncbi:hypothetical protein ACHAXS_009141 [Conticribra weissflogii]